MKTLLSVVVLGSMLLATRAEALTAGARHAGWLLPEVLAQVPPDPMLNGAPRSIYDSMSREQLLLEKRRLEDDMPGLAGPIILMASGAGSLLVGTYYVVATPSLLLGVAGYVFGAILLAGGVACAVFGIIWLVSRLNDRAPIRDHIAEIDRRLDSIYFAPPGMRYPSQQPDSVPPPPPPPPPSAGLEVPPPQMVLARF